jgi:nucleoside-diphosphate-sugar epimerase
VHNAVRGVEVVFHLGALGSIPRSVQDPLTSSAVNVEGTLNVLLAARDAGVRRVVFSSSSSIYGTKAELPVREDVAPDPISPYGVAKLAAERYCVSFSRVYDSLETVVLRYFNVFGPRQSPSSQYAAVIPLFLTAISGGKPITVESDGEQTRDFTYVSDVVAANIAAAERAEGGEVFNIGGGSQVSINHVLATIEAISARPLRIKRDSRQKGDVRHTAADCTRARERLAFRPAVPIAEGLRLEWEWIRGEHDGHQPRAA